MNYEKTIARADAALKTCTKIDTEAYWSRAYDLLDGMLEVLLETGTTEAQAAYKQIWPNFEAIAMSADRPFGKHQNPYTAKQ